MSQQPSSFSLRRFLAITAAMASAIAAPTNKPTPLVCALFAEQVPEFGPLLSRELVGPTSVRGVSVRVDATAQTTESTTVFRPSIESWSESLILPLSPGNTERAAVPTIGLVVIHPANGTLQAMVWQSSRISRRYARATARESVQTSVQTIAQARARKISPRIAPETAREQRIGRIVREADERMVVAVDEKMTAVSVLVSPPISLFGDERTTITSTTLIAASATTDTLYRDDDVDDRHVDDDAVVDDDDDDDHSAHEAKQATVAAVDRRRLYNFHVTTLALVSDSIEAGSASGRRSDSRYQICATTYVAGRRTTDDLTASLEKVASRPRCADILLLEASGGEPRRRPFLVTLRLPTLQALLSYVVRLETETLDVAVVLEADAVLAVVRIPLARNALARPPTTVVDNFDVQTLPLNEATRDTNTLFETEELWCVHIRSGRSTVSVWTVSRVALAALFLTSPIPTAPPARVATSYDSSTEATAARFETRVVFLSHTESAYRAVDSLLVNDRLFDDLRLLVAARFSRIGPDLLALRWPSPRSRSRLELCADSRAGFINGASLFDSCRRHLRRAVEHRLAPGDGRVFVDSVRMVAPARTSDPIDDSIGDANSTTLDALAEAAWVRQVPCSVLTANPTGEAVTVVVTTSSPPTTLAHDGSQQTNDTEPNNAEKVSFARLLLRYNVLGCAFLGVMTGIAVLTNTVAVVLLVSFSHER